MEHHGGDRDAFGMTGSDDERRQWLDDLGAAFVGSTGFATAIVEGEPGLGKSTILDAAARAALP